MPSVTNKLTIEKLVPGGQGLATLPDGKKVFLWNALPGEDVLEFDITKRKSKYLEAVATKIANASPHRIIPKDSCFLSTSPWQILDYDYELKMKCELLQESFRQAQLNVVDFSQTAVSTDYHDFSYRNKMEYSLYFSHADAKIHLAFHRRGSHAKIPISHSSIERPEILTQAQSIVNDLNARGEEARKYQSLFLRCSQQGTVSGGLFKNGHPHPIFPNLSDSILGHTYSYSPNGFFQINLPVYELALQEIKQHIQTAKVLDLYAGVGTIGLSVARDKELTLVEVDKSAYAELVKNCDAIAQTESAHLSGSPRAILAKSEETLDFISSDQTVILDPPRAGADKKLLARLLEVLPPVIIYLSCNPSTQARDLHFLTSGQKYRITKVQPFNFFPRTPHLENLVILQKSN